jgi:hypothetical protein
LALGTTKLAAGTTVPIASWWSHVPFDWHQLDKNMDFLREFFFSNRVVQWAPLAGALPLLRRTRPGAGLVLGWFLAYVIVKGTSPVASIERGDFWRLVMPAFPAFVLLVAFAPLCVPSLYRRVAAQAAPRARPLGTRIVVVAALALAVVPLAAAGLTQQLTDARHAVILDDILVPVAGHELTLHARHQGRSQRLTWDDRTAARRAFYRVYRTKGGGPDVLCGRAGSGSLRCELNMTVLETTRQRSYVDRSPEPDATYRVGVAANWLDDTSEGDVYLVSDPVRAAP